VLRMIQRQFHEPLERDPAAARVEFAADNTMQFGIAAHALTITEPRPLMKAKWRRKNTCKVLGFW